MPEQQYRKLGTGVIAVYVKRLWPFPWKKHMVLDYQLYEIEDKLNQKIYEMAELYAQHSQVLDGILEAKSKIKGQDDPYRSAPFSDKPLVKGKVAKKYRKPRNRPAGLWEKVRKHILQAKENAHLYSNPDPVAEPDDGFVREQIGGVDQPVGIPIEQNNQRKKGNQDNQNQSNG